jgi:tetratricopeptide (TPR) repeat protein
LVEEASRDYMDGDLINAKFKYERAIKLDPTNSRAKSQLRDIEKRLKADAGSDKTRDEIRGYIDDAKKALGEKDYSSARTYYNRANALDSTNSHVQTFYKDFKVAGKEKINTGLKYYLAGDLEKATDALLEALPAYEDNAGMNAFLGLVYYSRYRLTGEQDNELLTSAEIYLKKVTDIDPEYTFSKKIFDPEFIEYYSKFK